MRSLVGSTCACGLLALLLSACASTPVAHSVDSPLLDDALFAPQAERIDPAAVLAPSPEMLAFIASDIVPRQHVVGRQRGLVDALYEGHRPLFAYDARKTNTAAEAFATRSGNCLSLVLMTSSFAQQLGLEVRYQSVSTVEAWSRDEELQYLARHVNILLLLPPFHDKMLVDFWPLNPSTEQRSHEVAQNTIIAMYMNNRAVDLLAQRQFDRAYWWVRAAMHQDPEFRDAVNTLAVVYLARGHLAESERALRFLLASEPDNLVALDNLQKVLRQQGRDAEAGQVAAHVSELRPVLPFHNYDLGLAALKQGRYDTARNLFLKEMRRDSHYDKFHASLALAFYGLGDLPRARSQMSIAVDNSTTAADREIYSRMLDRLKSGQQP